MSTDVELTSKIEYPNSRHKTETAAPYLYKKENDQTREPHSRRPAALSFEIISHHQRNH
jgi:hypothetical protein